jgi:uncharacterized membrane protein YfcA
MLVWLAGALVIFVACFVMGLAGFGIGLVALALLPFVMPPMTAVMLINLYAIAFNVVVLVQLRRSLTPRALVPLVVGSVAGTPLGVWVLATISPRALTRLIGVTLLGAVLLELRGLLPRRMIGKGWGFGAGVLAGALGGAVGMPSPPVILYSTTQGWSPRTMKVNLQAFFALNQLVILGGYLAAGLLTAPVWALALAYALPGAAGTALGIALFSRTDQARFRRIVFALLFVSGMALLVRG